MAPRRPGLVLLDPARTMVGRKLVEQLLTFVFFLVRWPDRVLAHPDFSSPCAGRKMLLSLNRRSTASLCPPTTRRVLARCHS